MCLLTWRLYTLQFLQRDHYTRKAVNNFTRVEVLPAVRGRIFDRHGNTLVDTVRTYSLGVETFNAERRRVPREIIEERLRTLGDIVGVTPEILLSRYHANRPDRDGRVTVLDHVSYPQLVAVQERRFDLPGVRVMRGYKRFAVHHDLACHILGYVNEIAPAELEDPQYAGIYRPGDLIGRNGVEKTYEEWLRGVKGQRVVKVHNREIIEQELERIEGQPGSDLYLTLDLRLQLAAEKILGTSPGAIIVMDAHDGAIRAMASYPRFDLNLAGTRGWSRILADPARPMVHRAISGAHAPGSVLKVAMSVAGLVDKKVNPSTRFHCAGRFTSLGGKYQPRCWIGGKYGTGHGSLDISDALKQSCDIYYYNLALRLGKEGLHSWSRAFGLGMRTGIDLPSEASGRLPDCNYPGELVQACIGQERWKTTPLQMALMTAIVANGGVLVQPHVGAYVLQPNGERQDVGTRGESIRHDWPPQVLDVVRHAMWRVVNEPRGTAYRQRLPAFEYAGKTGSAEVIKHQPTHAWFVGFAPYHAPEVVIAVFVEMAGHGGDIAAPMARNLILEIFPEARRGLEGET